MKKLIIVAVAFAMVASMAPRAHSIGAFLSYWNGEDIDDGYGLGLSHQFKIIPLISAEARASWVSFDKDGSGLNLYPLEGLARVKLSLFYLGAGLGYYIYSGKNDASFDNSWGAFGVGGVEFTIAKIGAFAELKYTYSETKFSGTDIDLNASGIGVNIGVIFNWI
jgi:hypothetical protein